MKKISCIIILGVILLASCKKDKDDSSKTEILTNGSWKITAIMVDEDGNGSYETDEYAIMPSCVKDNYLVFKTGGDLELNEGVSKCDVNDPQTQTTDWSLSQNETRITIDSDEYIIDVLNSSTLRVKDDVPAYGMMITLTKR